MKALGDARKILSGKKSPDASRILLVVRQLITTTESNPRYAEAREAVRALVSCWAANERLPLFAQASGEGPFVEVRSAPTGAPAAIPVSLLDREQIELLERRCGVAFDLGSPQSLGIDIDPAPGTPDASASAEELVASARSAATLGEAAQADSLWRQAILASRGSKAVALEAAQFWIAGGNWQIAGRLAESPRYSADQSASWTTVRAICLASSGQPAEAARLLDGCAIEQVGPAWAEVASAYADQGLWSKATQSLATAERAFRSAAAAEPRLVVLAHRIEAGVCELHQSAASAVEGAADLDAIAQAREAVEEYRAAGGDSRETEAWLNRLSEREAQLRRQEQIRSLATAAEQGREVGVDEFDAIVSDLEPSSAAEGEGQAVAGRFATAADSFHRQGDWEAAARWWLVASRLGAPTPAVELAQWVAASAWAPGSPFAVARAVVQAGRARGRSLAGASAEALVTLGDARRYLAGIGWFDAVHEQIDAAARQSRLSDATSSVTSAESLAAERQWTEALAELDRIVGAPAELVSRIDALRQDWQRMARISETTESALARAEEFLQAAAPFAALRALETVGSEDLAVSARGAELGALRERAEAAAREELPVHLASVVGPPPVPGGPASLSSAALGWDSVKPKEVRVGLVPGSGCLMVATANRVAIVDGESLRVRHLIDLPEALSPGQGGDALCAVGEGDDPGLPHYLHFWGAESRRLSSLLLEEDRARAISSCDLSRRVGRRGAKHLAAQAVAFHARSGQLWALDTYHREGKTETRLHAFEPRDGTDVLSEHYDVGLVQLSPVSGSEEMLVSRMFAPPARRSRNWFRGALLDGRGRIVQRWPVESTEDEIYAFRRAMRLPVSGRMAAEYWYVDIMTGKVAGDGSSLVLLKPDGELFYQNRNPSSLWSTADGSGPQRTGPLAVHVGADGTEYLLWPVIDAAKQGGIYVVDANAVRPLGHIPLGTPRAVGALRCDTERRRAFAVVFDVDAGGFTVQLVDLAQMEPHR